LSRFRPPATAISTSRFPMVTFSSGLFHSMCFSMGSMLLSTLARPRLWAATLRTPTIFFHLRSDMEMLEVRNSFLRATMESMTSLSMVTLEDSCSSFLISSTVSCTEGVKSSE